MNALLHAVSVWGEMVKFSHSIFALPFALMAAFLAARQLPGGRPSVTQIGLIVLCMVGARSAAMTFNRIVDARLDARNPRTANRALPAGKLGGAAAWFLFVLSSLTFGVGCVSFYVFFENTWPILLAGPVLAYLCLYSFTKRFTRWSHFYLGSGIAFAPVAAWLVIDPASVSLPAWVLMIIVTCWIAGFDIIYACQDIEVDRRESLHSLPSRIGPRGALWIARGAHAITALGLIALGRLCHLGWIYTAGAIVAVGLLIVQNLLVRPGDYRRVNLAFFTLNGVVSVVLAASVITDVLLRPAAAV